MASDSTANSGTGQVRTAIDEKALAQWMSANIGGYQGNLSIEQFNGGQSNPTYKLNSAGQDYVLRRSPPGPLHKGAHDVVREARILTALAPTPVPVPAVMGVCERADVLGSPFYIMALVEGRIFWDASLASLPKSERAAYFDAMNITIAALHQVDPQAVGLEDYAKPGNFFERQIARWTRQYTEDAHAGRDDDMEALIAWMPGAIPARDELAITHGDFRCDNIIFHPEKAEVVAVLDWELSTLGHPLSDFAYHALMYRMPPDIVAGLNRSDPVLLGLPTEADYVAAYCARTGRTGIDDWDFYIAFNLFRLAAIFHGIKGRVVRGTAASAHARDRAASFPRLARLAREAMDSCR